MTAGGEPFGSPGGDPTYAGGVPGELLGDLGRKPWSDYRQNEEKVLFSVIFFGVSRLLAQGSNQDFVQQNLEKLLAIIPPPTTV